MYKRFIILLVAVVILGVLFYGLNQKQNNTLHTSDKFIITTSFYPLYFFASQIAGPYAEVINITPAGSEPHDYEPSSKDIATIENSRLLILNGIGLESWGSAVTSVLDTQKTAVLIVGDTLNTQGLLTYTGMSAAQDPHIWLSPVLAQKMVEVITESISEQDPTHAGYYKEQSDRLTGKLQHLDTLYQSRLANCLSRDIVTSHAAFGYLADTYNLKQISIAGLSPDAEPSVKQLTQLAGFVRDNDVKYIFFESLASPRLADTLATETGAQTLVLNPLEGLTAGEIVAGQTYFTEMEHNVNNLAQALQCR